MGLQFYPKSYSTNVIKNVGGNANVIIKFWKAANLPPERHMNGQFQHHSAG
jgi:hypothetical protein